MLLHSFAISLEQDRWTGLCCAVPGVALMLGGRRRLGGKDKAIVRLFIVYIDVDDMWMLILATPYALENRYAE